MDENSSPKDPMKALFIDTEDTRVSTLEAALKPEFMFSGIDITSKPHKAIELMREQDFDVIYIHDEFERLDLEAFFNDLTQLKGWEKPLCVQYRDKLSASTNRKELKILGFGTIISCGVDEEDKKALEQAIVDHFHLREVEKKTVEVNDTIDLMLKEIDEAAQDIKRGAKPCLNKIPTALVEMNTGFHTDVFEKYFEALTETSESAEAPSEETLKIPEEILRKNLPHLSEDTYKGVSRRVWKKMLEIHGKKAAKQAEREVKEQKPAEE